VGTLVTINPALDPNYQGLGIAALQGLAAGTILYVTFFEVLDKERKRDSTPGLIKLAFVILGFCLMICLEVMGKDFRVLMSLYTVYLLKFLVTAVSPSVRPQAIRLLI
jgi:ZIP Zinc transporter.